MSYHLTEDEWGPQGLASAWKSEASFGRKACGPASSGHGYRAKYTCHDYPEGKNYPMLTVEEEAYVLNHAYIPEHSVGLMTSISGGEPFLIEDCFCCYRDDWVIVVAYPLTHDFIIREMESFLDKVKKRFHPVYVSLMAPEMPQSIVTSCRERENDHYYTLDIHNLTLKGSLKRTVHKAKENLHVERSRHFREEHRQVRQAFIERAKPSERVKTLLFKIPEFVDQSEDAVLFNAWDKKDHLAAFYVVDLAPKDFSTYVIGCHSKKNYVSGASDLLCFEMINLSKAHKKKYIHLGLGVNQGIQQFKKKWGGRPTRRYEMCDLVVRKPSILERLRMGGIARMGAKNVV